MAAMVLEDGGQQPVGVEEVDRQSEVDLENPKGPKNFAAMGTTSTLCTEEVKDLFEEERRKQHEQLARITGEPGDVELDRSRASCGAALTFSDISFTVKEGKGEELVILAPISGHFEAGTLAAVMGPSGSGKTTLLDILAGKKSAPHGGTVHLNGRPRDRLFGRICSYVPQDDIMPAHLTVEEEVLFHFYLKQEQPSKFSSAMAREHVRSSLADLGLLEVKDSAIGDTSVRGISGGQLRRLSLACGLAGGPQIVFCDEPTSGLSATDAEATVKYMRLIAHKHNVTIVVVIHQPRRGVAKLFDELVLLTSHPGRCVYNGPMRDMPTYCAAVGYPVPSHVNPTDYIMDLVSPGTRMAVEEEFVEHFDDNIRPTLQNRVDEECLRERTRPLEVLEHQRANLKRYGRMPPIQDSKYGVNFRRQLLVVGGRQVTLCFRDSRGVIMDLLVAVGKGLILGLTYMGIGEKGAYNQLPFYFMLMMAASIDGMKGMPKLISERRVMKMETSEALYSEWAYIIPFTLISWVQAVCANTIFVLVLFAISRLPWALFGAVWLWTTLLYLTMDSMFLMLSAIAKDAATASVMALPFFMLFLLFNGFTVNRKTAPWYEIWLVDISPVAYAIEQGIMSAARHYVTDDFELLASLFGYRYEPYTAAIVMLVVMTVFRVTQVLCLKLLNNIQR